MSYENMIYGEDRQDFLAYRDGSGGTVEITDICVASNRRTGVGKSMVQSLMSRCPDGVLVWAITRHDNIVAQHFYEAMRFRVVGVLRSFYKTDNLQRDSVDAVMYGRNVGDKS